MASLDFQLNIIFAQKKPFARAANRRPLAQSLWTACLPAAVQRAGRMRLCASGFGGGGSEGERLAGMGVSIASSEFTTSRSAGELCRGRDSSQGGAEKNVYFNQGLSPLSFCVSQSVSTHHCLNSKMIGVGESLCQKVFWGPARRGYSGLQQVLWQRGSFCWPSMKTISVCLCSLLFFETGSIA